MFIVFLDHSILRQTIVKDARKKVEEKKEALRKAKMKDNRNKDVLPSDEVMMEDAKNVSFWREMIRSYKSLLISIYILIIQLVLATHVVDLLDQVPDSFGQMLLRYKQRLPSLSKVIGSDCVDRSASLSGPPAGLKPVAVKPRQLAAHEDVNSIIGALAEDKKQLSNATNFAERICTMIARSSQRRIRVIENPKKLWLKAFDRIRSDLRTDKDQQFTDEHLA